MDEFTFGQIQQSQNETGPEGTLKVNCRMLYTFVVTLVSLTHASHFKWIIYAARWSFLGSFHLTQSPFWHREHPYVVPTLIWTHRAAPQGYSPLSGRLLVVPSCKLPSDHAGSLVGLNAPAVSCLPTFGTVLSRKP